jgi:diguanylate cyclase (GGDEF)-like protein
MLDVDHFKQINDSAGHQAGDLVLCQLAGMLLDEVRDSDVVARFGGEEFVILAPHTARAGAIVLAERIRKAALRGASRLWRESVTVSIGVAELKHVPDTAESLLARADGAMYEAKRRGRDRVCG